MTKNAWPTTQASLIHRLQDPNDHQAWSDFNEAYRPMIEKFCQHRGLPADLAEEAAQDVLCRVFRNAKGFDYDPERGKFRGYLGLITRQVVFRLKERESQRREVLLDSAWEHSVCDAGEEPEWVEHFNNYIIRQASQQVGAEFSEEAWKCFEMRYFEALKPGRIAELLSLKPSQVSTHIHKVKNRMIQQIHFLAEDIGHLQ